MRRTACTDQSRMATWSGSPFLTSLRGVLCHISKAPFVQLDESPIRMNGRRGYIWLATIRNATYIMAAPGRLRPSWTYISPMYTEPRMRCGYVLCCQPLNVRTNYI